MDDLNVIASRYVLGFLRPEEMVQLADQALNEDHCSPKAADLAELRRERHPSSADVVPLFLAWLSDRGVELPDVTDATWRLLTHHIEGIVHGRVPPLEGLLSVDDTLYYSALPNGRSKDVERRFGVTALCAAYSTMEDLEDAPAHVPIRGKVGTEAMAELASYVSEVAKIWWKTYGPSPVLALDSLEAQSLLSTTGINNGLQSCRTREKDLPDDLKQSRG